MFGSADEIWLLLIAVLVLLLFPVQYIALRIRDTRANPPDPHLGRKSILYFFFNAAVFLVLAGLTISAMDWAEYLFDPVAQAQQQRQGTAPTNPPALLVQIPEDLPPFPVNPLPPTPPPRDWFNDQQRTAAGLATSGILHALLFWLVVRFATNDRQFPAVRRAFAGTRLIVAGLIVLALSTTGLVMAFQRGETDYKVLSQILAVASIWGPVALLHVLLVLHSSGWRRTVPVPAD